MTISCGMKQWHNLFNKTAKHWNTEQYPEVHYVQYDAHVQTVVYMEQIGWLQLRVPGFYYAGPIYTTNIGPSCGCNYGTVRVLDRYVGSSEKSYRYNKWIYISYKLYTYMHMVKMYATDECVLFKTQENIIWTRAPKGAGCEALLFARACTQEESVGNCLPSLQI